MNTLNTRPERPNNPPGSRQNVDGTAEIELDPDEPVEVVVAVEDGFLADGKVLVVLQDGGTQNFGREVIEDVRTGQI